MWSSKVPEKSLNFIREEVYESCKMRRVLHFKAVVNSEKYCEKYMAFSFHFHSSHLGLAIHLCHGNTPSFVYACVILSYQ